MPFPLALAAAGASLLGSGINAASAGATNAAQIDFAREMYNRQRKDSLADFAMINEYNSPQAQMARLKMAGLNPNLVYKNGATQDAAPVRSSSQGSVNLKVPEFDPGAAMGAYVNTTLQTAQADNLKAQNTQIVNDAILKSAQTAQTLEQAANTRQQREQAGKLFETTLQGAQANLRKTNIETDILLNRDEREAAQNASNLKEAAERVLLIRAQTGKTEMEYATEGMRQSNLQAQTAQIKKAIEGTGLDNELKRMDIMLRKMGVNPQDPVYLRVLGRLLDKFGLIK